MDGSVEEESVQRDTEWPAANVALWKLLMPVNVGTATEDSSDKRSGAIWIAVDLSVFSIWLQMEAISCTLLGLCLKLALMLRIFLFIWDATATAGPDP